MFDGKFTAFTTNEGLPSSTIQAVYEDREGNLAGLLLRPD